MAGNVATYDSARKLHDAGIDLIRIGIGNGTLCTTRNVQVLEYHKSQHLWIARMWVDIRFQMVVSEFW